MEPSADQYTSYTEVDENTKRVAEKKFVQPLLIYCRDTKSEIVQSLKKGAESVGELCVAGWETVKMGVKRANSKFKATSVSNRFPLQLGWKENYKAGQQDSPKQIC